MADVVTTIARQSGFIPDIWAARALEVLRNNIVLTKLVARDSEYEPGWVGQTLTIPYPGTFVAQQKTENNLAVVQTPQNGGVVQLTLTNHKYVDFIVEDLARTQASQELMDRYITPAAIALAEDVETNLINNAITTFSNPSVGTAGVDISAAPIRSARRTLNAAKIPLQERALVVSPKDEVALLGDTSLQTYFAFSQTQAIREGASGRMYGFDVYMSQLLDSDDLNEVWNVQLGGASSGYVTLTVGGQTTAHIAYNDTNATILSDILALPNIGSSAGLGSRDPAPISIATVSGGFTITLQGVLSGSSIGTWTLTDSTSGGTGASISRTQTPETVNLAFHPNALMVGFRPFRQVIPNAGVEVSTMMDPESGIMIRVMHQYNIGYRGHYIGYDILYGIAALRSNHGVLVLS